MKKKILVVFILIFLCSSQNITYSQDPLGGAVLGVGLDNFANKLKEAIDKAIGGGLILEIQAGGQISQLIQQARVTYQDQLNVTFYDLNSQQQRFVNDIKSLTDDFTNKTYTNLNELESRAQATLHILPFSNDFPQIFKWYPSYALNDNASNLIIRFEGDFYDLPREDYDAILKINDKEFKNNSKSSQFISFEIPKSEFSGLPTKIKYNYYELLIPYRVTSLIVFHSKEFANFKLPLIILPNKTGKLTYTTTTQEEYRKNQGRSPSFDQNSHKDDIIYGGEHSPDAIHCFDVTPGWLIDIPSIAWGETTRIGDVEGPKNIGELSTSIKACVTFNTRHHGGGSSGHVAGYLYFTEYQMDHRTVESSPKTVDLDWSKQIILTLPTTGSWKAQYEQFDGSIQEFSGPFSNQYITVSTAGGSVTVKTLSLE